MKTAHDIILRWCRSFNEINNKGPRYETVINPVMRERNDGTLIVIDLNNMEKDPNGKYDWEKRNKVIAEGKTWDDVLNQLKEKKYIID